MSKKNDGKRQCPDCNKRFVDLNNHKKCNGRDHKASQRSPDDKQQCPDCKQWFVDLNNHKKCNGRGQTASQRTPDDKQQCPDCNKWFVDLNNHKKCDGRGQTVSQRTPDDKQQCPDCNKWFVDLNNHKKCDGRDHKASQRSPDDEQQCPDCKKWFMDLNNHKKCDGRGQTASQRTPDDKQQCPDCNKRFVDLNNHKKCDSRDHKASQRSPDDKQQCPDCKKWFVDLNNHKKCNGRGQTASQRTPDDKQQCPDCKKWFVDLNNHKKCDGRGQTVSQRTPDDKQHCPDCNKWFVDLNNHKKCDGRDQTASQRSPDDKQQCPDCNKWFVDLNNHKKCDGRGQTVSQRTPDDKQQCPGKAARDSDESRSQSEHKDNVVDTSEMDALITEMVNKQIIGYSHNPKRDIKNFFEKEVKMEKSDIDIAMGHFRRLREKIVGLLNCEMNFGTWTCCNAGSHFDGTKVARPNEFDCTMFPVLRTKLVAEFDDTCEAGACKVKVVGDVDDHEQDLQLFLDGSYVNSKRFKAYVFEKLERILQTDRKLKDARKFCFTQSFALRYKGIPTDEGMESIDIDFVPSLNIKPWPPKNISRDIKKVIPDQSKATAVQQKGFNVTAKHWNHAQDPDLLWQVSFSYAEKTITKYADKVSWKPSLRTLKRVLEIAKGISDCCAKSNSPELLQIQNAVRYVQEEKPELRSSLLTTYHIRTLMWWQLYELTLGEHVWGAETMATRFQECLRKFQKMMTGEMVVPHFFLPQIKDILPHTLGKERAFLYVIARATEVIFNKKK